MTTVEKITMPLLLTASALLIILFAKRLDDLPPTGFADPEWREEKLTSDLRSWAQYLKGETIGTPSCRKYNQEASRFVQKAIGLAEGDNHISAAYLDAAADAALIQEIYCSQGFQREVDILEELKVGLQSKSTDLVNK